MAQPETVCADACLASAESRFLPLSRDGFLGHAAQDFTPVLPAKSSGDHMRRMVKFDLVVTIDDGSGVQPNQTASLFDSPNHRCIFPGKIAPSSLTLIIVLFYALLRRAQSILSCRLCKKMSNHRQTHQQNSPLDGFFLPCYFHCTNPIRIKKAGVPNLL